MYNLKDKKLKPAALDDGDGGQALFECLNRADLHLLFEKDILSTLVQKDAVPTMVISNYHR